MTAAIGFGGNHVIHHDAEGFHALTGEFGFFTGAEGANLDPCFQRYRNIVFLELAVERFGLLRIVEHRGL